MNGIYIEELGKWIRVDARGNKEGVNATFSVDSENLAFPVREEKGEVDVPIIFSEPDKKIIAVMKRNTSRSELWLDLPSELDEA